MLVFLDMSFAGTSYWWLEAEQAVEPAVEQKEASEQREQKEEIALWTPADFRWMIAEEERGRRQGKHVSWSRQLRQVGGVVWTGGDSVRRIVHCRRHRIRSKSRNRCR